MSEIISKGNANRTYWSDEETYLLIELVRYFKVINDYKSQHWQTFGKIIKDKNGDQCKNKWSNLLKAYGKHKLVGGKEMKYFERLYFLDNHVTISTELIPVPKPSRRSKSISPVSFSNRRLDYEIQQQGDQKANDIKGEESNATSYFSPKKEKDDSIMDSLSF